VRTLEYEKNKTAVLYSKHKISNIPCLFKLSFAYLMDSTFSNGGLPNHFDNYFTEIASVHQRWSLSGFPVGYPAG